MVYIILNRNSIDDIAIASRLDGTPLVFESEKWAENAKNNMAFRWKVVEIN